MKRALTGLQIKGQQPILEYRAFGESEPKWLLWLAYDKTQTSGTYLILERDGSIMRETSYPDGGVESVVIKPRC